jgi:hypothetical protein
VVAAILERLSALADSIHGVQKVVKKCGGDFLATVGNCSTT